MVNRIAIARMTARLPHLKGMFHLTGYFSRRQGRIDESVEGFRMTLDLGDLVQRHTFMRIWEIAEVRLMKKLLRPGSVFLDVGAGFGYYTAVAARRVGKEGRVYAFELEPGIFSSLSTWVDRSGAAQVSCVNAALSDGEGSLSLFVPPSGFRNYDRSVFEHCPGMTRVEVRRTTLDGFFAANGIKWADVLKLDVEGHEDAVLAGGLRTLRQGRVEWILCEFNRRFGEQDASGIERLYAQLHDAGFGEQVYDGGPPLFPQTGRGLPNRLFRFAGERTH